MPSLYAHNKFGKLVIKNLPVEYKEIIRRYPNSFRLGLQGPDYLFFYRAFSMTKSTNMVLNFTNPMLTHLCLIPLM